MFDRDIWSVTPTPKPAGDPEPARDDLDLACDRLRFAILHRAELPALSREARERQARLLLSGLEFARH